MADHQHMVDHQLNEVARPMYDTLDGGKGALEQYAGHQWLQNRPPPPQETPRPPSPPVPFIGSEESIRRNDVLIAALNIAPNVLFDRYHQFGQVGVLAWCSEFEEMVSEIKSLGFSGDMAGKTRESALEACREVLKLDLEIPAQLIIMYLAGQIARLRNFLGVEEEADYPQCRFPMPTEEEYALARHF